jgi:hypothetical protein
MKYTTFKFRLPFCALLLLLAGAVAAAQEQRPSYREYRGVKLGMTAVEARAKLGEPVFKSDEQDVYVFSNTETTQVAYDATKKVVTISTDYTNGVGAPDYVAVVGEGLLTRPDGSLFRAVEFRSEGVWISYNKSASVVPVVTITIQALK